MRSQNWHSTPVVNQLLWHGHDPATHLDFDYRPNSSTLTCTMRSRSRPPAPILLLWQQHAAVRGHLSMFQQHEPESNIYTSAEPAFYVGSVYKHNSERTSHVQAKVYNLYAFASFSCLAPPTFRAPAFCKSWKKVPYHNLILSKSPRITIIVQKSSDKCWNILYKWWLRFTKMEKPPLDHPTTLWHRF